MVAVIVALRVLALATLSWIREKVLSTNPTCSRAYLLLLAYMCFELGWWRHLSSRLHEGSRAKSVKITSVFY